MTIIYNILVYQLLAEIFHYVQLTEHLHIGQLYYGHYYAKHFQQCIFGT